MPPAPPLAPAARRCARRGAFPELLQDVEHAAAGEHAELGSLLERGDEEAGDAVELGVARLVREVGDGNGGAAAGDLPLPDAPGGEAGDDEAHDGADSSEKRHAPSRRGQSTSRRAERSSESQELPSLGLAPGSSDSAAAITFATGRGPAELRRPTVAGAAFGASHINSVSGSAGSSPGAGEGVLSTGRFPVSISPSTIPAAQTSARSSTTAPAACSGAMYAGVPAPLDPSVPSRCARPKSSSFTRPSSQTNTFAGFRSRCSTPREWACASPSAICSAIRSASSTGSGPFSIRLASVSPRSNSMTRYAPAGHVPTSKMVTMAGWSSFATASASFLIHSSEKVLRSVPASGP